MGGLFGGGRSNVPPPPPPRPVAPLPDEEGPEVREAQRRRIASIFGRTGRSSTLLSESEDGGGSGAYNRRSLGGR